MTPVTPPAAMVEAAARALWEYNQWPYNHSDISPFDELSETDRDNHRRAATSVLTAALSLCEVGWGWRPPFGQLHSISAEAVHDQGERLDNVRLVYALPVTPADVAALATAEVTDD